MSVVATSLYDDDFYAWLLKQAEFIKQGRLTELDREHLAEELEAMGRSEKRELINRLAVLLEHLLKCTFQPNRRSSSWTRTILEQRFQLTQVLEDSPSLRHELEEKVKRAYEIAIAMASKETNPPKKHFPAQCPFSLEQLFDENFLGK